MLTFQDLEKSFDRVEFISDLDNNMCWMCGSDHKGGVKAYQKVYKENRYRGLVSLCDFHANDVRKAIKGGYAHLLVDLIELSDKDIFTIRIL